MSWFWREDVWLPPGYTWESLSHSTHFTYPQFSDPWTYPFIIAATLIALRYLVLTPLVYTPIARLLQVKEGKQKKQRPFVDNAILEVIFESHRTHPSEEIVTEAAGKLRWTNRQVERWLRQRSNIHRTPALTKFCNMAWELTYYICYTVFGVMVLWERSWLWDIDQCFVNFPEHNLDSTIWCYYMLSLGYYWSMTITHFFQHRRKDSTQLFVHHLITILLISFSYVVNFVRMGTLVLIVHECGDIPMLIAKLCKLCPRYKKYDTHFFILFLIVWLCTRVGLYPFWILRVTLFRAHHVANMFYPVYYIFNSLLLLLLVIHVMWTYLILKIVVEMAISKEILDVRSSSEASNEDDDDDGNDDADDDRELKKKA